MPESVLTEVSRLEGDEDLCEQLLELGFTPGEMVQILSRAPFGEPVMVEVRGSVFALRKREAQCIKVKLYEVKI